jgi:hypothetical protein
MASALLHPSLSELVSVADDDLEIAADPTSNRRTHERLKATELPWLKLARLKYGSTLRVLDISVGGILFETDQRLNPDSEVVIELAGEDTVILAPSRVLRCRVASLGEILTYQGACAFKRPVSMAAPGAPQVPNAGAASTWQKVIARYRDGRMLCGFTNDFHPSKAQLHLSPSPYGRDITVIPLVQLKALFFVREFAGDPERVDRKDFTNPPQGRKVEITFHDDEVLLGTTLGYRSEGHGFFVQPADRDSNNLRVFVTASGIQRFRFV